MSRVMHEEVAQTMRCCNTDRFCASDKCMAWQGQRVQGKDGLVTDTHEGYCKIIWGEDPYRMNRGPG